MKVVDDRKQEIATLEENKKIVDAFLSDPEKKKDATQLAHQIHKEVGDEWFKPGKLLKKFKITITEVKQKLLVLQAFSLVAYKEQDGWQLYKIDISKKDQRQLLTQEIEFHKAQLLILNEKLSKLD